MKKLSIVLLAVIMSGCSAVSHFSPGITSKDYTKALNACSRHDGVRMVNKSMTNRYTAYCNDGHMVIID